jgi:chemotaxis protein CheY-P-specific phosphatase CheC
MNLTEKQVNTLDRFLLQGTVNALDAIETMFGLEIESSSTSIEIAPAVESENIKSLGNEPLYVVASDLVGDIQGSILLLMKSDDFRYLGEVMRPVLSLLFLCSPNADLESLDKRKPDWMQEDGLADSDDVEFYRVMIDTLGEIGNVLMGLYTRAICEIFVVNTHHRLPKTSKDPDQQVMQRVLASSAEQARQHLIVQTEFIVQNRPIRLWLLISPTKQSLQGMLDKIECEDENKRSIETDLAAA